MILLRGTRRLLKGASALLSEGPPPEVGPLGTWYANTVALPYPGRSLVLFTVADTMLSVVAPGRSLRTTLPVFQRRVPVLLLRLGLPGAWIQARADDLAGVYVARAGAGTLDRTVLGTMTDAAYQIRAEAEGAGSFERLDLDRVEAGTLDRTVLGTMTDAAYQIRAEAEGAGSFERLDLDRVEDGLAQVPLGALRSKRSSHGFPADAVAELARV